jgi:NADH dehydrogenase FAD-containing subunit
MRVAIVGSGLAGLSTAVELLDQGCVVHAPLHQFHAWVPSMVKLAVHQPKLYFAYKFVFHKLTYCLDSQAMLKKEDLLP